MPYPNTSAMGMAATGSVAAALYVLISSLKTNGTEMVISLEPTMRPRAATTRARSAADRGGREGLL